MVKEEEGDVLDGHRMVVETIKWCSTDGGRFDRLPGGSETAEKAPVLDHLS